jgi:hypothetical protein
MGYWEYMTLLLLSSSVVAAELPEVDEGGLLTKRLTADQQFAMLTRQHSMASFSKVSTSRERERRGTFPSWVDEAQRIGNV